MILVINYMSVLTDTLYAMDPSKTLDSLSIDYVLKCFFVWHK